MEPWLYALLIIVVICAAAAAGFWLVNRTFPAPGDGNRFGRIAVGGLAIVAVLIVIARTAKLL